MNMDFRIRKATKADCAAMLELVQELAAFERAPDAVTVTQEHFEESGFGERPVWWAYVACAPKQAQEAELAMGTQVSLTSTAIQDPLLAHIMEEAAPSPEGENEVLNVATMPNEESFIQLPDAVVPVVPEELSSVLPQPTATCDKIIGFALYYIRYSTWKGQRMYLEDIIVTEAWRGKGVGTALMDALIGEAKAAGLHGISWQVLNWNEPALKFYERYGVRFDAEWMNAAIDV